MAVKETADFELAAALVSLLGEPVPHDPAKEADAAALRRQFPDDRHALLKAAELCGEPKTPRQFYLCTKIFSWLGRQYDARTVECAEAYLLSPGWDALPSGQTTERGVKTDLAAHSRAGILMDLGVAYAGMENYERACSAYLKAYETEPYRIEYAVEASSAMVCLGREKEAMDFLLLQKHSPYCRTVKYRGSTGRMCYDSFYRDTLDRRINCLKKQMENGNTKTGRSL